MMLKARGGVPPTRNPTLSTAIRSGQYTCLWENVTTGPKTSTQLATSWPSMARRRMRRTRLPHVTPELPRPAAMRVASAAWR